VAGPKAVERREQDQHGRDAEAEAQASVDGVRVVDECAEHRDGDGSTDRAECVEDRTGRTCLMRRYAFEDDAGHRRHRQRSTGADRDDADRDQPRQSERCRDQQRGQPGHHRSTDLRRPIRNPCGQP